MAENKKSFLLYCDSQGLFEKLSNEQAGKLIKHIFKYVNDKNPEADDPFVDLAFESIKVQLKRDLIRYQAIIERNRNNGAKGGRPPLPTNPENPLGFLETQINPEEPKKPDIDNDSDTDIDKDILLEKETKCIAFEEFWSLYPKKVDKAKCEKKFKSLKDKDKEVIKNTLVSFLAYKPFPDYSHPNPLTYLNGKRWEDELPAKSQDKPISSRTNQLQPKYYDN